jgi:hypothetical protein
VRPVVLLIAAGLLATASASSAATPERIHSPEQVRTVFAHHGFVLQGVEWTLPVGPINLANVKGAALFSGFQLQVVVWPSIVAAKKDESYLVAEQQVDPNREELRAGNITASFDATPTVASKLARVQAAMKELTALPAVLPLPSGLVPLSAVSGNTRRVVRGHDQTRLDQLDLWCGMQTWAFATTTSTKNTYATSPECAPLDADGVQISFSPPGGENHKPPAHPLEVSSTRPAKLLGVTADSRLNIFAFPYGAPSNKPPSRPKAQPLPPGEGVRFPASGWRCAARRTPPNLICYRTKQGKAWAPFVLFFPTRRLVEVETITNTPDLFSEQLRPPFYSYSFDG